MKIIANSLERNKSQIFLLLLISYYIYLAVTFPLSPVNANNLGWNGWWDQSQYLKSAISFSELNFKSENHWYPIGYSAIAAVFALITPSNPFIYINILLFSIYVFNFLSFFGRQNINISIVALLTGLFLFNQEVIPRHLSPIIESFIIPWNTIAIAAIYLAIINQSLQNKKSIINFGILCGALVCIRPVDLLPIVPYLIILYCINRGEINLKKLLSGIATCITSASLLLIPLGLVNYIIHANIFGGSYISLSSNIGVSFQNIIERFYWIFINAEAVWNDGPGIISVFPLVVYMFPMAIWMALIDTKKYGAPMALIVSNIIIYLAYNDFSPHNIFRFNLIHYISWSFPVVICFGLLGLLEALKAKKYIVILMLISIVVLSTRIHAVVLPVSVIAEVQNSKIKLNLYSNVKIDGVDLIGYSNDDWMRLTTTDFHLHIDGVKIDVFNGYKVSPIEGGVRVIFNKPVVARVISIDVTSLSVDKNRASADVKPLVFLYKLAI